MHTFGSWLTARRKALRIARATLAQRVGCATVTLQKIELDERRPSELLAARIAEQLQIVPSERATFIRVARGELPLNRLSHHAAHQQRQIHAPSGLIGREADQHAIHDLIAGGVRLLTFTGTGGVGKTRLALQIAHDLQTQYADGACMIDLTPLTHHEQVVPAIAQALSVAALSGVSLLDRVIAALSGRQMLLLLDNFEHVLDASPALHTILQAAPNVTMLVTSRAILHISAEQQYVVRPLQFPQPRASHDAQISGSPAVQLFIARVNAVLPGFALTPANQSAIGAICRRLDGLPLAIELAAARCKLFTPSELLVRLDHALAILTHGARDLPDRHQALRSTLDWSYRLLAPSEQRLLQRLAVFVGGWTLVAAETICSEPEGTGPEILDAMQTLIDQSLIREIEGAPGTRRFGMLETIREYASEQLAESGEAALMRSRHAAWALHLAESMDRVFSPHWRADYIDTLTCENDNLRAALTWYRTQPTESESELRLIGALWWFWAWRAHQVEAQRWLAPALSHPWLPTLGHARALLCAGDLLGSQGERLNSVGGAEMLDASLRFSRALGDVHGVAIALLQRGRLAWFQGDFEESYDYLAESLERCRSCANQWGITWCLISLGNVLLDLGDNQQAQACFSEAMECADQWGYPEFRSWAIHNLGRVARIRGELERAVECYQASIALFRERDATYGIGSSLIDYGRILHLQGDDHQALALYRECFPYTNQIGNARSIARWLEAVAGIAATQGQPARAARLLGASAAIRSTTHMAPTIYHQIEIEHDTALARSQLEPAVYDAAWAVGQALTVPEAIAEAHAITIARHDTASPATVSAAPAAQPQPSRG
jgi:predicted ATPase/DNA-binding XRE family transcriptional regulator